MDQDYTSDNLLKKLTRELIISKINVLFAELEVFKCQIFQKLRVSSPITIENELFTNDINKLKELIDKCREELEKENFYPIH